MVVKKIEVEFSSAQWFELFNAVKPTQKRRMNSDFNFELNQKIQAKDAEFKCWLKCSYNWFKCEDSRKEKCPFWTGQYRCINLECDTKLQATLQEKPDTYNVAIIKINWTKNTIYHDLINKKDRCNGKRRKELMVEVSLKGVSRQLQEEFHQNPTSAQEDKQTRIQLLKNLRQEFRNRDRISRDLLIDSQAAKTICEHLCLHPNKEGELKGFVQQIYMEPFGLMLISSIQIKMWLIIQESNPIWYFDATGSIIKKVRNQIMPFLYSIVMHDKKNKSIIPVAEFISSCQNETWISHNLYFIKSIFLHNIIEKNKFKLAPLMVTDFCFALINSIHSAFNGCSLLQYLVWTHDYLMKKRLDLKNHILVRTYLCSTHFLKSLSVKAKKILSKHKEKEVCSNILRTFLLSFTLLQNSTNVKEFDDNLKDLFYVFNSKTQNESFIAAMMRVRVKLSNREAQSLCFPDQPNEKEKIDLEMKNAIFSKEIQTGLINNSPYTKYYENILKNLNDSIETCKTSNQRNLLFDPGLFNLINDQLYIAPLWSGMLIGTWQMQEFQEITYTRLSNNPVENHFGHTKNNLLKKRDNMPSEFCSLQYERLQYKYFMDYHVDFQSNNKPQKIKENQEQWRKDLKIKREKGFYYKSFSNFGMNESFEINRTFYTDKIFESGFDNILSATDCYIYDKENEDYFTKLKHYSNTFESSEYQKFKNDVNLESTCDDSFIKSNYFNFCCFNTKIESLFCLIVDDKLKDSSVQNQLPVSLQKSLIPITTPSDGNCLWHMVSRSICGNCSLTTLLKDMTTITLLMLKETFVKIIFKELRYNDAKSPENLLLERAYNDFQNFVQISKRNYQWGHEYHLLAIATFLSMKIYIYSFWSTENDSVSTNTNSGLHLEYSPVKDTMFASYRHKDLIIYGHYDAIAKHYTSLIPNKEKIEIIPNTNLFKEFC